MKAAREKQRPFSLVYSSPATCYNQDITQALQDTFKTEWQMETIDEATIRNLSNSLGTEDKYHEKYVQKLLAATEMCQQESEDFANLELWLFCLSGVHMMETKDDFELRETDSPLKNRLLGSIDEESFRADSSISGIGQSEVHLESQQLSLKSKPELNIQTSPSEAELLKNYKMIFSEELFPEELPMGPVSPIKADICTPKSVRRKGGADRLNAASSVMNTKESDKRTGKVSSEPGHASRMSCSSSRQLRTDDFLSAVPAQVLFEDYEVGKVYEASIEVKNTSVKMQKCSMLPPKTGVFLVTEGRYPDERGVIAPGLSCKFPILFNPVNNVDYNDFVQFKSPGTCEPITVWLKARREHPAIQFPGVWECGHCFLGAEVQTVLTAKNIGGQGRFWIVAGKHFGSEILSNLAERQGKEQTTETTLKFAEYSIFPCHFSANPGEIIKITVTFRPEKTTKQNRDITLICDNTKWNYYTLSGEGVILTTNIISCEAKWSLPVPGEEWDFLARHYLRFEKTYPCDRMKKELQIYNKSSFALSYRWLIAFPRLDKGDPVSRIMGKAPFSVFPQHGTLTGNKMKTFNVAFSPSLVSKYHAILQLIFDHVPASAVDENMQYFVVPQPKSRHEESEDDEANKEISIRILEVDVQGSCVQYDVSLHPPLIEIPGAIVLGSTIRKCFEFLNNSDKAVFFQWERKNSTPIIDVIPPSGCADERSSVGIEVMITGTKPGVFREYLHCQVQNMTDPIQLQLDFAVVEQQIVIEEGSLNFSALRVGTEAFDSLTLKNMAPVKMSWKLQVTLDTTNETGENFVSVFPEEGVLPPLKRTKIQVCVQAKSQSTFKAVAEVLDGDGCCHSSVFITVDVISPSVSLQSLSHFVGEVCKGIPFDAQITIVNQTCLETEFRWGQPEGTDAKSCLIKIEPLEGQLGEDEQKIVNVTCTVNDTTDLHDVRIPCWVDGMEHPIYWSLSGNVVGVEGICAIAGEDFQQAIISERSAGCQNQLKLNFGKNVELGTLVEQDVLLTNMSLHPTSFRSYCIHFSCIKNENIAETMNKDNTNSCTDFEHLLVSSFSKRRIDALLDEDLQFGRGVSFLAYPYTGILNPYESVTIKVYAKADMWGLYTEKLFVQMENLQPVEIDVLLSSTGIPLKFNIETPGQPLIIRFGSYVPGSKCELSRSFTLENKSAFDIHVDFTCFTIDDDDQQLLNLEIYGQGEDGELNEIDKTSSTTENFYRGPTPLLRLNLTIHEGEPEKILFHLIPSSLWVKARSQAELRLCFKPPSPKVDSVMRCFNTALLRGFIKGLVSLHEEALCTHGKVLRRQRHLVQQLKVDFTAVAAKPELRLDFREEKENIYFEMEAGEFFVKKERAIVREKSFTATNISNVAIKLKAVVASPFHVKYLILGKPIVETTSQITVQVRGQVEIIVRCTVARRLVNEITRDWPCDISSLGISCVEASTGRQLVINQSLTVLMEDSDLKQVVPVKAVLHLPNLTVSKRSVDFENCFIGDICRDEIIIANNSLSSTPWRINIDGKEEHAFSIQPRNGSLEACFSKDVPKKVAVDIYFRAREAMEYTQKMVIRGPLRIPPITVRVKGRGTMDYYYKKQYETVEGNVFND